jgi:hypothetical protein
MRLDRAEPEVRDAIARSIQVMFHQILLRHRERAERVWFFWNQVARLGI